MSCWSKVPKSPENAEVYHRRRQRAWLNLLRLGLFQHRRGPAAKMRPGELGWWLVRNMDQKSSENQRETWKMMGIMGITSHNNYNNYNNYYSGYNSYNDYNDYNEVGVKTCR